MSKATGRDTVILIKDKVVSTYFQEVEASSEAAELDVTAFGDNYRQFIGGLVDGSMSMSGFWDATASGSDDTLNDILDDTTAFPITVGPIGLATVGNPVLMLSAIETSYNINTEVADAATVDAEFEGAGGAKYAESLHVHAATTPTGTPAVDTGLLNPSTALTTSGARAHLHVTTNTYNQATTVKVQHSSDSTNGTDGTWADLITFTAVTASSTTSEIKTVADGVTINKYVRASTVGSAGSGSITFALGFLRNY